MVGISLEQSVRKFPNTNNYYVYFHTAYITAYSAQSITVINIIISLRNKSKNKVLFNNHNQLEQDMQTLLECVPYGTKFLRYTTLTVGQVFKLAKSCKIKFFLFTTFTLKGVANETGLNLQQLFRQIVNKMPIVKIVHVKNLAL